ncbi:MAG: 30S ribosomal protein S16 [Bacteroidia bacterium]|nr:MAG: 30S ribosomal protein S16 [Bacteroidia bacterium]
MPLKIRLARRGKKNYAFYHIVVADSRAPRDGRFIKKLGTYNPNTDPASIELDFDQALDWLSKGAVPTDTCRSILSKQGVMLKKHLLEGVRKGAFDEEEAERRFEIWKKDKELKLQKKVDSIKAANEKDEKKRLEAEMKINKEKAAAIAKKKAQLIAKEEGENTQEETPEAEGEAPEEKDE